jgi:hypothetical protein
MRGAQNFNLLFTDIITNDTCLMDKRQGRDAALDEARNICLLHRYFFHGSREIEPGVCMSYESVVAIVAREFFLSKNRVIRIVENNLSYIGDMKRKYKGVPHDTIRRSFAKQYPHLSW